MASIVAVIDTNVWVSAFLNPAGFPARLYRLARQKRFALVTSLPLLEELYEVLHRPRIMRIRDVKPAEIERFVRLIAEVSTLVRISGELHLCRDPRDDIVIETAIIGGATHIVSRDEDLTRDLNLLQELERRNIRAVTVSRFLEEIAE